MSFCAERWRSPLTWVLALLVIVSLQLFTAGSSAGATIKRLVVTTSLSAANAVAGARITVLSGTAVTDSAVIVGLKANSRGDISYFVYSDPGCRTAVFDATPAANAVTNGVVPPSKPFTSA